MSAPETDLETYRAALEGLGYRMLGDCASAQDMAQEAFLKWYRLSGAARAEIHNPRAWLLKVVSRLALDRMKSARLRREHYVGPWLPEPWLVEERSPADHALVDESVTLALLLTLERLSPPERAAFILREVFGLEFAEIAEALGKSAVACRKLFSRARAAVREGRPRYECNHQKHEQLFRAFSEASERGDLDALKAILAEDAVVHSDGGGLAVAALRIIRSQDKVSRFLAGIARRARRRGVRFHRQICVVNGLPALLMMAEGRLQTLIGFSVVEGRIETVFIQRNPEKLRRLENAVNRSAMEAS